MMPTSSALHSRRYENESSFVFRNEIYHRRQNSENYCSDDRSSRDRESSKSNYAFYSDAKEDVEPKYENVISKSAKEGREKKSGAINLEEEKCNYGEDRVGSEDVPDVPEAPVRDPSSLKFVKYGPGHEKFPSWPGSLPTESGEKPQRSHSWTERTAYPKEKVTSYARPHGKRPNPAFTQQLKTVMERCEKISPETYKKTMDRHVEERKGRIFLPGVDREGKSIGDEDYMVPSPPERDNPLLDQTDLAKYYSQNSTTKAEDGDYSIPYENVHKCHLTEADLEEYSRSYDEISKSHHQSQGSYAQSEGYHSYVSSSESTTTPLLDRLRRDSDGAVRSHRWEEESRAGRDSVVTTSSGSVSSNETLKWHGSMSDVSLTSASSRSRQLIAHSSRVPLPQRHYSESVLCSGTHKVEANQQLKLFPVSTYTVQPCDHSISTTSAPPFSVAERINELERQQQTCKFSYLDPEKRHRVSDPTLKAIQKKALLSFYERHRHSAGSATTQSQNSETTKNDPNNQMKFRTPIRERNAAPLPPPRQSSKCSGRQSRSASDADVSTASLASSQSASCLLGPIVVGPSICIDDWVPERPPKKTHLQSFSRAISHRNSSPVGLPFSDGEVKSPSDAGSVYERSSTPELPLPPPPPYVSEEDLLESDEPLPPPPPEVEWHLATAVPIVSTSCTPFRSDWSPQRSSTKGLFEKNEQVNVKNASDSSDKTECGSRNGATGFAYEIQYDQGAINAILECNRLSKESQKRKSPIKSHVNVRKEQSASNRNASKVGDVFENRRSVSSTAESGEKFFHKHFDRSNSVSKKKRKETSPNCESYLESDSRDWSKTSCYALSRTEQSSKSRRTSGNSRSFRETYGNELRLGKTDKNDADGFPPPTVPKAMAVSKNYSFQKEERESESRIPVKRKDETFVHSKGILQRSNSKAAFLTNRKEKEKESGLPNCEGSYKLTMGESTEGGNGNSEKSSLPLEIIKTKNESAENTVLDNRLTLEPPDLIPKMTDLRRSSSAQDARENSKRCDYGNERYRLLSVYSSDKNDRCQNGKTQNEVTNLIESRCRVFLDPSGSPETSAANREGTEEERASKPEVVVVAEESNEGISISVRGIEPFESSETEKRISSPIEEMLPDSSEDRKEKTECSVSAKLVERSTGFGRTDSVRIVDRPRPRSVGLSVDHASSQTDLLEDGICFPSDSVRQKIEEEMECERLSRDLASHLSPLDKLQGFLVPASERMKSTDYVAELFQLDLSAKSLRQSSSCATQSKYSSSLLNGSVEFSLVNGLSSIQIEKVDCLPSSSPYFTTSESKTKMLTSCSDKIDSFALGDSKQLQQKKEELIARLDKKLGILRQEQIALSEELNANEELGAAVASHVAKLAKPQEAAKYRLHVEEVGEITSLLLGLSGRLARAENALLTLSSHHEERKIHESKRNKLEEQLAEAKQLKENIDKRSNSVAKTLEKYLSQEEFADYRHFIEMKAKLIVDSREIADKILLGEEQLAALKETLSS